MEAHSLPRNGRLFLPRSPKVLRAFSDERLVEQVRRGNDDAFEAVYDRHHLGILAFCRHMLSSADEAEDAVQQTFISAYDAMHADAGKLRHAQPEQRVQFTIDVEGIERFVEEGLRATRNGIKS